MLSGEGNLSLRIRRGRDVRASSFHGFADGKDTLQQELHALLHALHAELLKGGAVELEFVGDIQAKHLNEILRGEPSRREHALQEGGLGRGKRERRGSVRREEETGEYRDLWGKVAHVDSIVRHSSSSPDHGVTVHIPSNGFQQRLVVGEGSHTGLGGVVGNHCGVDVCGRGVLKSRGSVACVGPIETAGGVGDWNDVSIHVPQGSNKITATVRL
jgi:hypothetical protein